jgi:hypothetical protein
LVAMRFAGDERSVCAAIEHTLLAASASALR